MESLKLKPEISEIKLKDIKLWAQNPRKISKQAMAGLKHSINKFGYVDLLIVNKRNNELISGHQRIKILLEQGAETVPVVFVDLDKREQETLAITMNNNAITGQWTEDLLNILEQLQAEIPRDYLNLRLEELRKEVKEPKPDESDVLDPEITEPETSNIQIGDIFTIEGNGLTHRLMCGDSTNKAQVEKLLNGKKIDLMLTDPPYNVDYGSKNKHLNDSRGSGNRIESDIKNDNKSDKDFFEFLFTVFSIWQFFTKAGGSWYVWHADSEGYNFRKAFIQSGLSLKQCLIWIKNTFVMGRQDYQWKHEPCIYGWKDGAAHYFINDHKQTTAKFENCEYDKMKKEELIQILETIFSETRTTILKHNKPAHSRMHPTTKPVALFLDLIYNSSRPHEIIADAFLGSGTTMLAAHQLNRNCYGMEFDPKYCKVILTRMLTIAPDLKIYKNGELYVG